MAEFTLSARTVRKAVLVSDKSQVAPRERRNSIDNAILPLEGDELISEIGKLWDEAQAKFLAIGRYLVRAFELYEGTFEETVLGKLPFGRIVAYQLRAVADAVDSQKLPEDRLPRSYATAYKLISLPPFDYEEARKRGFLRSDVTRPEVETFKRQLRDERLLTLDRKEFLRHEQAQLHAEVERAEDRMKVVRARLAAISDEIGDDENEAELVIESRATQRQL